MQRKHPYTGPRDTNDFDDLPADEAARLLHSYELLGDCFEDETDDDMIGRGWLIEDPLTLVKGHKERGDKAQRELAAAVRLARNEGESWMDIARIFGMPYNDVRTAFEDID